MRKILIPAALIFATQTAPVHASEFYKISVSRKDNNFYKVDGQEIYIKTRYCYEYATNQDSILQVDSNTGFTIGKLIFTNTYGSNTECDVEKILKG